MTRAQLTVEAGEAGRAAVLRPVGVLDLTSAPVLRAALLKSIADAPTGVIVRTDALEVSSATSLSVFSSISRQAAEWPGVPIVLVDGLRTVRHQPGAQAVLRLVPIFDTMADAVDSLCKPPPRRLAVVSLPAVGSSAAAARRFVRTVCADWDVEQLTDAATMIASELVENAVTHAESDARLRLELRRGILTVAVRDGSPTLPVCRPPSMTASGGRGIALVQELAQVWGSTPTWDGGKVVWAVLRSPSS